MGSRTHRILCLPGDGIGPEVTAEACKLLDAICEREALDIRVEQGLIGGAAYDACGTPLPEETLSLARACSAALMGAVGGPQYEQLERDKRPERGLLGIRSSLNLFANLRPAVLFEPLIDSSSLKREVISGLDILIVRELVGGIYFGTPRGIQTGSEGVREGINTMVYREDEIERIAHTAFTAATKRGCKVCSVDKANVLEVSELWREVVESVAQDYPDVRLDHLYVDNAAMQLVRDPTQFDVIVTSNMFGDILSDLAAMLTGSIGMLPSASLNADGWGLYEPVHGSAPDIAGRGLANPLATILSLAMLLRYSLNMKTQADRIETAVGRTLEEGLRTADIAAGVTPVTTSELGDAVVRHYISLL